MLDIILIGACITVTHTTPNVENYRWVNIITQDPHGIKDRQGRLMKEPYLDPPIHGWQYEAADASPYYWDDANFNGNSRHKINHPKNTGEDFITFKDCPAEPRLKRKETVEFTTCLFNTVTKQSEKCIKWALNAKRRSVLRTEDTLLPLYIEQNLMPK